VVVFDHALHVQNFLMRPTITQQKSTLTSPIGKQCCGDFQWLANSTGKERLGRAPCDNLRKQDGLAHFTYSHARPATSRGGPGARSSLKHVLQRNTTPSRHQLEPTRPHLIRKSSSLNIAHFPKHLGNSTVVKPCYHHGSWQARRRKSTWRLCETQGQCSLSRISINLLTMRAENSHCTSTRQQQPPHHSCNDNRCGSPSRLQYQ
jgi:hypothetical protein